MSARATDLILDHYSAGRRKRASHVLGTAYEFAKGLVILPPSTSSFAISVIVPAHNEQDYISACLEALVEQQDITDRVEVLVMANACTDATVQKALEHKKRFALKSWKLRILRVPQAGKPNALNCGDQAASGTILVYLDADVTCGPLLLSQLQAALATDEPLYASGTLKIAHARSWFSRAYGKTWGALPFMKSKAVGAGLFAVNRAGRALWGTFPSIISDDTFVRLHFTPDQRREVPEHYVWPLVEGFSNLVNVRRRQDAGVDEIKHLYPELIAHEGKEKADVMALFLRAPISFLCYAAVKVAVRLRKPATGWTRGR